MIQRVVDEAVKIATKMALAGTPVERVTWVPPKTATEDPFGHFVVKQCSPISASDTPPWEK